MTVKVPELKELVEAGVHFGHASGRWHPKMKPYIFCTRDKLHIIDLEKTREQLASVLPVITEKIASGQSFVIVGTKRQVSDHIKEMGERLGISYVSERWLGGTMTNFGQMMQSIKRLIKTEELLASDEVNRMIKKERVMLQAELKRMNTKFSGLRNFTKKPQFLIVIDPSHEHNAVKEARFEGVEIFAVADTNSDPSLVNYVIPANDDGPKSLKLILGLLEAAIVEGLEKAKANALVKAQADAAGAEVAKAAEEEVKIAPEKVEELITIEEELVEKVEEEVVEAKAAKAAKVKDEDSKEDDDKKVTTKEA